MSKPNIIVNLTAEDLDIAVMEYNKVPRDNIGNVLHNAARYYVLKRKRIDYEGLTWGELRWIGDVIRCEIEFISRDDPRVIEYLNKTHK